MKRNKVISRTNLPTRAPIHASITCALALDYWKAPQWLTGAVVFFFILLWVAFFIVFKSEDRVDLLKEDDHNDKKAEKKIE